MVRGDRQTVMATSTDYIGMWYRARARLGVDDRIEFMFINPASGDRRTVALRHRHYDGAAGIQVSARQLGMQSPQTASSRQRKAPGFWRRWQGSPESRQAATPQWRQQSISGKDHREPVVQWLSLEQTKALYQRAAEQKVSVNSLLLLALHRSISATLLETGQPGSWCFPVNMRNSLAGPQPEMNLSSAFYMTVAEDDKPERIDRSIRAHLKANVHWRYWHLARIGRWIGQRGVNWLCERLLNGPQHLGSFSSLGEWQMNFASAGMNDDTVFACCGPGSPTHPVANGVIVVNGCMSLALKLHPSLGAQQSEAERCLQHWVNGLGVAE